MVLIREEIENIYDKIASLSDKEFEKLYSYASKIKTKDYEDISIKLVKETQNMFPEIKFKEDTWLFLHIMGVVKDIHSSIKKNKSSIKEETLKFKKDAWKRIDKKLKETRKIQLEKFKNMKDEDFVFIQYYNKK